MNVIVSIDGREAIPVRAIPWLTFRTRMSPDVIVSVLTGRDELGRLEGLAAYHLQEGGVAKPIEVRDWRNIGRNLKALEADIRARHGNLDTPDTRELRHRDWRMEAIPVLPAASFVWRDEYERLYNETYPDHELHRGKYLLDFTPFIPDKTDQQCVMEGFEPVVLPASEPRLAATGPEFMKKRGALIKDHIHEWPLIESHLNEASENGLTKAAKVPQHGMWFVERARVWAKERGYLHNSIQPAPQANLMHQLPGKRYGG